MSIADTSKQLYVSHQRANQFIATNVYAFVALYMVKQRVYYVEPDFSVFILFLDDHQPVLLKQGKVKFDSNRATRWCKHAVQNLV